MRTTMRVLLIFALLCAWEGSQWLVPVLALDPLPYVWISAAAFGLVAIAGAVVQRRRRGDGLDWLAGGRLAVYGALALGSPAVLLAVAQRYSAAEVATAALAGVPVIVVVAAQVSSATGDGMGEALLPAIAGLGGALLLIPVRLPESSNGWIGFGLDLGAVLLAGIFSVLAHRLAQTVPRAVAIRNIAVGNALTLMVVAGGLSLLRVERLASEMPLSAPVAGVALVTAGLTAAAAAGLLRELEPLAWASRFLIVPLLAAIEGYVLLRPTLSVRAMVGAGLMAGAAALLLRGAPMVAGSVVPVGSHDEHLFGDGGIG